MFAAKNVEDLPPPHNPSDCFWAGRFEAIERCLREETDHDITGDQEFDLQLAAGREFLGTLTAQDRSRCPYHDGDWAAIADESVRILEELGGDQNLEAYTSAANFSRRLGDHERWLLSLLFLEPIEVVCGSFNDGQHRGCALRFSGAPKVVVHVPDD